MCGIAEQQNAGPVPLRTAADDYVEWDQDIYFARATANVILKPFGERTHARVDPVLLADLLPGTFWEGRGNLEVAIPRDIRGRGVASCSAQHHRILFT